MTFSEHELVVYHSVRACELAGNSTTRKVIKECERRDEGKHYAIAAVFFALEKLEDAGFVRSEERERPPTTIKARLGGKEVWWFITGTKLPQEGNGQTETDSGGRVGQPA